PEPPCPCSRIAMGRLKSSPPKQPGAGKGCRSAVHARLRMSWPFKRLLHVNQGNFATTFFALCDRTNTDFRGPYLRARQLRFRRPQLCGPAGGQQTLAKRWTENPRFQRMDDRKEQPIEEPHFGGFKLALFE